MQSFHPRRSCSRAQVLTFALVLSSIAAACSSGSATPSPSVAPSAAATPTAAPTVAASPTPTPQASATGPAVMTVALKDLAGSRYFGTALAVPTVDRDQAYAKLAADEFNQITPENAMKWGPVEPTKGQYDWAGADEVVAFAQAHGDKIRGHALVWHTQLPGWVENGTFTAAQLNDILKNHITTEVSRYKGKIYAWDVVNEVIADDASWRPTIFYKTLGKDFVANAFKWAHAADPAAKLYINDYDIDGGGPKADAEYELVKSLKAAGVPIDGVGFQAHFDMTKPFPSDMAANMQRFADLGLEVALTELDVRMDMPATPEKLAQQADYYKQAVSACLAVKQCVGITVWGFGDKYSWVPYTFPTQGAAALWDDKLDPKPALVAVQQALAAGK